MSVSDFTLGGLASVAAAFVTNPLEVIKTRLQLQGELAKRGTYFMPYRGIFGAFATVAKNEGILGLQKGLIPALYFQFIINSVRLGIYTTADKKGWTRNNRNENSFPLGVFWGSIGGALGAFLSSPFFMIKTQLQAQAAATIAVGYQHKHSGVINAFKHIYSKGGWIGLWHGSGAAIPRASIGSGVQIATFGKSKALLQKYDIITNPAFNSFFAGVIAGTMTSISITPPDVITTRLYNQNLDENGRGIAYKNWADCFQKIYRSEGFYGFYKGFWANYLRMAPHSTLVLFFFDQLILLRDRLQRF